MNGVASQVGLSTCIVHAPSSLSTAAVFEHRRSEGADMEGCRAEQTRAVGGDGY